MTGNEKIQFLVDLIAHKKERLISGDVVVVRSDELSPTLTIDEQVQALTVLVENKSISYEASPVYQSFLEIDPRTRLDIVEIAQLNGEVTEEELEEELLSLVNYKIRIINLRSTHGIGNGAVKVTFNPKTSTLHYGDKECHVPDGTLQHYTCKLVFKNRNIPVSETDIIDAAGIGNESIRPVYDAMLAVNKLINKNFKLPRYLKFSAGKVRINRIYQG